jgi:ribosomal RNA-processing protein 9
VTTVWPIISRLENEEARRAGGQERTESERGELPKNKIDRADICLLADPPKHSTVMSSFFTLPASQKKRKRPQAPGDAPAKSAKPARRREARDESISGSDISDDDAPDDDFSGSESEDEELKNEDPAAKRIRLAEQYLSNTQKEVLELGGFDAAEIDQEILRGRMGERLAEDTAESKGKLYRFIADDFDWSGAQHDQFRTDTKGVNGVAIAGRNVYTVTSDRALVKWELPDLDTPSDDKTQTQKTSRKPKKLAFTRGSKFATQHHQKDILCVAASQDGKFVATGGADNKLIIWDANTLKPLRIFSGQNRDNGHRDSVISLVFRRGTNQLFSSSKDRTVKIWSLDELAYIETLFGHQDEVLDVSALSSETCVTVGARDRTARFWKVVEESQLVFRGGGPDRKPKRGGDDDGIKPHYEGSMERVACIDDETFITGADNGSLSLWNIHKKKPVFTYPLAHGLEPPTPIEERSAEIDPTQSMDAEGPMILEPQPRWITALKAIPFSDVFVTGSWDGHVRAWRISSDKRRIEPLGALATPEIDVTSALELEGISTSNLSADVVQAISRGAEATGLAKGVVNDLDVMDKDERGKSGCFVLAAISKEHKLGRWDTFDGKNCAVLFNVPRKAQAGAVDGEQVVGDADAFASFD